MKIVELDQIIEENKESLIKVLQEIQNKYGFVSKENAKYVAEYLGIYDSEVYGILTFYNDFKMEKRGKYVINVCLGTACYVKGANDVSEEITKELGIKNGECTPDGVFSLDTTRCLGCCSLAPVVKINDDIYGYVKKEEVSKIIEKYRGEHDKN